MRNKDTMTKSAKEIDINLIPLLKALLKKAWVVALVGVFFAIMFFGVTKLTIKPTYRCGFTAYVNNQQVQNNREYLTTSDLMASKELVKTFSEIIKCRSVLTKAAENTGLEYTYERLKGMVSTEIQNETEIISVYVVHRDPRVAYDLACEIAKVSPSYMTDIIDGSSMRIIDYPEYNENKYKPSYLRYTIIGFLAGALLVLIILIVRYFSDDTIRNDDEVEAMFNIPIIGVIPDSSISNSNGYGYSSYKYGYQGSKKEEDDKTNEKE